MHSQTDASAHDQLRIYDNRVRRIISRVPAILENHRLAVLFKSWKLTSTPDGLVVLFGVLDDDRITRQTTLPLERYLDDSVVHHIATTACDGQYPVFRCNSRGAAYAVVLNAPRLPQLPEQVGFPGYQPGRLAWGMALNDRPVTTAWGEHMMLAGMTGSGKSTMLRGLVAQGLQEKFLLALCDIGARTFAMLENHPALITPLVTRPERAIDFARAILGEVERRDRLYRSVAGYPDTLDEYNTLALAQGQETLKRLLVVFDEYTDLLLATGGARADFSRLVTRLVVGARKWGITFVFAGQQFQREASGWIRDQCALRVCFRVEDHSTASIVADSPEPLRFTQPGRALMKRVGRFQAYDFDKAMLVELAGRRDALALTPAEQQLARQIGRRLFSWENVAQASGLRERAARRLVEAWDARGLAPKSDRPGGGRYLTEEVLSAAGATD